MNWEALGAIGEVLGAVGVIVTLVYLALQVRQNTRHVRAQMGHDGWLGVADNDNFVMGEDAAASLAKAELEEEDLSEKDLKVVDAYFKTLAMHVARVEHLNSQGLEIYTDEQAAQAFIYQFNCRAGRAWWQSNQDYISLITPKIGARISQLLSDGDIPSRAESLKQLRTLLSDKSAKV